MSYTAALFTTVLRRLLFWQLIIIFFISSAVWVYYGYYYAISFSYGGSLTILVTLLRGWRLKKINNSLKNTFSIIHIYIGAIERFILVILGMGIGMGGLKFLPFPMIMGFTITQISYFFNLPDRPNL